MLGNKIPNHTKTQSNGFISASSPSELSLQKSTKPIQTKSYCQLDSRRFRHQNTPDCAFQYEKNCHSQPRHPSSPNQDHVTTGQPLFLQAESSRTSRIKQAQFHPPHLGSFRRTEPAPADQNYKMAFDRNDSSMGKLQLSDEVEDSKNTDKDDETDDEDLQTPGQLIPNAKGAESLRYQPYRQGSCYQFQLDKEQHQFQQYICNTLTHQNQSNRTILDEKNLSKSRHQMGNKNSFRSGIDRLHSLNRSIENEIGRATPQNLTTTRREPFKDRDNKIDKVYYARKREINRKSLVENNLNSPNQRADSFIDKQIADKQLISTKNDQYVTKYEDDNNQNHSNDDSHNIDNITTTTPTNSYNDNNNNGIEVGNGCVDEFPENNLNELQFVKKKLPNNHGEAYDVNLVNQSHFTRQPGNSGLDDRAHTFGNRKNASTLKNCYPDMNPKEVSRNENSLRRDDAYGEFNEIRCEKRTSMESDHVDHIARRNSYSHNREAINYRSKKARRNTIHQPTTMKACHTESSAKVDGSERIMALPRDSSLNTSEKGHTDDGMVINSIVKDQPKKNKSRQRLQSQNIQLSNLPLEKKEKEELSSETNENSTQPSLDIGNDDPSPMVDKNIITDDSIDVSGLTENELELKLEEERKRRYSMYQIVHESTLMEENTQRKVGMQISFFQNANVSDRRIRHRRTFKELSREVVCPFSGCNRTYASKSSLATHVRLKHNNSAKSSLTTKKGAQNITEKPECLEEISGEKRFFPNHLIRPSLQPPLRPSINVPSNGVRPAFAPPVLAYPYPSTVPHPDTPMQYSYPPPQSYFYSHPHLHSNPHSYPYPYPYPYPHPHPHPSHVHPHPQPHPHSHPLRSHSHPQLSHLPTQAPIHIDQSQYLPHTSNVTHVIPAPTSRLTSRNDVCHNIDRPFNACSDKVTIDAHDNNCNEIPCTKVLEMENKSTKVNLSDNTRTAPAYHTLSSSSAKLPSRSQYNRVEQSTKVIGSFEQPVNLHPSKIESELC